MSPDVTPVPLRCVLFDLDGTLADTAPDLGGAANDLLAELGQPPLPLARYRPECSKGGRGMLAVALERKPGDPDYESLRSRYLELYAARLDRETRLFPGVEALLDHLQACHIAFGIVTNKPMQYTAPVTGALGLAARTPCIIGGDSAPRPKPAPDPLLMACTQLKIDPAEALYVGDDERDVQAGRAAGTRVAAAAWGYVATGADPSTWNADAVLDDLPALRRLVDHLRATEV
ncbi:MAG TPA: phosphoglycolate phosphatase [Nevskiaceae bacterium]|nr:phosphoglycolate phosphatase [Nevskiaceae bacterium]